MKSTLEQVQEIKKHGYHLDLGDVISQTFENFKKIALLSGAIIIVLAIVLLMITLGVGGILGLALNFTDFFTEYSSGNVSTTFLLINMAVSVVGYALISPVVAGIMQIAHNAETNRDFDFSTAFSHYKTKHFKELFLATAVITFVSSGISTLSQLGQLYFLDDLSLMIIITIVNLILAALVPLLTLLTIPFIIFGNLSAMEAIKASIVTVSKRFWMILLLMIIFFICAMLGFFALCIGIFFTLPIFSSAQYIIYRNAIPMEEKDELDEIGSSEY